MTWRISSRRGSTCARRGSDRVTVRVTCAVRAGVYSRGKIRRGCSGRCDALARNDARGRRRNAPRARDGWNTSISSRTRTRPRRGGPRGRSAAEQGRRRGRGGGVRLDGIARRRRRRRRRGIGKKKREATRRGRRGDRRRGRGGDRGRGDGDPGGPHVTRRRRTNIRGEPRRRARVASARARRDGLFSRRAFRS